MANFQDILNKPAADIKAPPAYPVGTYHCLVDGPPAQEESSQKKTPCRVYKFKILSPMGDVDQAAATEQQIVGKLITGQGAGAAFYLTEDAAWRYKEFLVDHLGIEEGSKTLLQLEAEAPGRQCLVKLKHEISQDGKRVFHRIESTAHV
jgi:hypothetical protein